MKCRQIKVGGDRLCLLRGSTVLPSDCARCSNRPKEDVPEPTEDNVGRLTDPGIVAAVEDYMRFKAAGGCTSCQVKSRWGGVLQAWWKAGCPEVPPEAPKKLNVVTAIQNRNMIPLLVEDFSGLAVRWVPLIRGADTRLNMPGVTPVLVTTPSDNVRDWFVEFAAAHVREDEHYLLLEDTDRLQLSSGPFVQALIHVGIDRGHHGRGEPVGFLRGAENIPVKHFQQLIFRGDVLKQYDFKTTLPDLINRVPRRSVHSLRVKYHYYEYGRWVIFSASEKARILRANPDAEWRTETAPKAESTVALQTSAAWELFDKVYVISLPERKDRLTLFLRDLELSGWPFKPAEVVPGIRVDTPVRGFPTIGAYGCSRSHLKALDMAIAAGAKSVLVMEDDCCFAPNFKELVLKFIQNLPEDWNNIMLGGQLQGTGLNAPINEHCRRVSNVIRMHAYALRGEALLEYRAKLERFNGHCDVCLMRYQQQCKNIVKAYAPRDFLAGQRGGPTDNYRVMENSKFWNKNNKFDCTYVEQLERLHAKEEGAGLSSVLVLLPLLEDVRTFMRRLHLLDNGRVRILVLVSSTNPLCSDATVLSLLSANPRVEVRKVAGRVAVSGYSAVLDSSWEYLLIAFPGLYPTSPDYDKRLQASGRLDCVLDTPTNPKTVRKKRESLLVPFVGRAFVDSHGLYPPGFVGGEFGGRALRTLASTVGSLLVSEEIILTQLRVGQDNLEGLSALDCARDRRLLLSGKV